MRALLLVAISAYQRYLSPHKSFCCAYSVHTGHSSCSVLGFRAVRRFGALAGLGILRRRVESESGEDHQSGYCDCDLPCDLNCDFPSIDSCSFLGDIVNGCGCDGCDWPDRKRKNKDEEKYVYIPPNSGREKGRNGRVRQTAVRQAWPI